MGELLIPLDTPLTLTDTWGRTRTVTTLRIPTPIRAAQCIDYHTHKNPMVANLRVIETLAGLPCGAADGLTVEDFTRVLEAIGPLFAPFQRLVIS